MRWLLLCLIPLAPAAEMISAERAELCAMDTADLAILIAKALMTPEYREYMKEVSMLTERNPRLGMLADVAWRNRHDEDMIPKFYRMCAATGYPSIK